jgi:hypothetical protein
MAADINHYCDDCNKTSADVEKCLCSKCLDDIKREAYEEGRKAGVEEEKNSQEEFNTQ